MFHIQREYQKTSSRRADIQSSFTRVDPRARLQEKVLGKDQVRARNHCNKDWNDLRGEPIMIFETYFFHCSRCVEGVLLFYDFP